MAMAKTADDDNEFPEEHHENIIDANVERLIWFLFRDPRKPEEVAPIKTDKIMEIYHQTGCKIVCLEKSRPEYKIIEQYFNDTTYKPPHDNLDYNPRKISNIFKVTSQTEEENYTNFKKMTNRKLLWHATPTWNILKILKEGLKPGSDGRICFADRVSLAAFHLKYKTNWPQIRFVLLCEVALGRTDRRREKHKDSIPPPVHGESTHCLGRWQPSGWKKLNEIFSEKGDVLPDGDPNDCDYEIPERNWFFKEDVFLNVQSEYRVYDGKQTKVRFIVQYSV